MHMTALLITLPSITLCSDCARGDRCQGRALSAEQTQRMTFMASQHTASSYWERLVRRTRRAMPSWWITSSRQAPSGEAGRWSRPSLLRRKRTWRQQRRMSWFWGYCSRMGKSSWKMCLAHRKRRPSSRRQGGREDLREAARLSQMLSRPERTYSFSR